MIGLGGWTVAPVVPSSFTKVLRLHLSICDSSLLRNSNTKTYFYTRPPHSSHFPGIQHIKQKNLSTALFSAVVSRPNIAPRLVPFCLGGTQCSRTPAPGWAQVPSIFQWIILNIMSPRGHTGPIPPISTNTREDSMESMFLEML